MEERKERASGVASRMKKKDNEVLTKKEKEKDPVFENRRKKK